MRRVNCRRCEAVIVEEVPWGNGKHQLTNAYMLFLARWARRISWKETAAAFHTSWEKVFDAVEHVVTFGLAHRTLGPIDAIGVDEPAGRRLPASARTTTWIKAGTKAGRSECDRDRPVQPGSRRELNETACRLRPRRRR